MTTGPTTSPVEPSMRFFSDPMAALKLLIGAIVAVFLGFHVVQSAISHHQTPKPAPIDYWQDDSVVRDLLATQQDLDNPDSPTDKNSLVGTLTMLHHAAPLERRTLYLLMSVLDRLGQEAASSKLTSVAAELSLRDGPFRSVHAERLVEQGQHEEAARSFEAMIRTFPSQKPLLMTIMANRSSDATFRAAMIERLIPAPVWRRDFLVIVRDFYQSEDIYFDIVKILQDRGSALTSTEYGDYLFGLIRWKGPDSAYASWVEFNQRRNVKVDYGLFDGSFILPSDDHPFGWMIPRIKNVVKSFRRDQGTHGERELSLLFFGDRTARPGVEQWLALHSGPHTFSGESSLDGLQAERGLVWRIYCSPGDGIWRMLATTKSDVGSHDWRAFNVDFTVPDAECSLQLLRLEAGSLAALDTVISGSASYRRLAIRRRQ